MTAAVLAWLLTGCVLGALGVLFLHLFLTDRADVRSHRPVLDGGLAETVRQLQEAESTLHSMALASEDTRARLERLRLEAQIRGRVYPPVMSPSSPAPGKDDDTQRTDDRC